MSQPDLAARLRAARPVAPATLRERVRTIAAQPAPSRRRPTWRLAAVVGLPATVAAAVAAAVLVLVVPGGGRKAAQAPPPSAVRATDQQSAPKAPAPYATAVTQVRARATRIVAALGGRPLAGGPPGVLRFHVPLSRVAEAVRKLSALGTVTVDRATVELRLSRP